MPQLFSARAQMGTSLVFHIVFSVLGVGLPLLLCITEGLALRYRDPSWMRLARQWSRAFAIVFAIGAVSGVIVEFEIVLLWPTFARYIGSIIGLAFAMEGFAFFTEGIFLGLYLYGWDRLSPRAHWLCSFPLWISGGASAWFILTANSWMNSPAGFTIKNGVVTNVNPFAAIFNPATPFEATHMILACYVAVGFAVAAIYAVAFLRGHRTEYNRKGLMLGMAMGSVAIPLQIISGDFNARFLEQSQPIKYAAMEGIMRSGRGLPLYIGGIPNPDTGQVSGAIQIPHGESLISHFDLNSPSVGMDAFPKNDWPSAVAVHLTFDLMVACGFFLLLVAAVFWFLFWRKRQVMPERKWLLAAVAACGPLGFLAIESGWMVTEEGRQPWIIYGIMRVSQAATPSQWINVSFAIFSIIYILLGTTLIGLLLHLARNPMPARSWQDYIMREPQERAQEAI
jgi:cytochrome d ubiquinol oxidase subunit I